MEDDLAKWYLTPLGPKDRFIELNLMSCLDVVWLDLYNPNFHTPFIVYLAGLASISLHKLNRCILHLSWLVAIYFSQHIIKISKIQRQGRGTKGGGSPIESRIYRVKFLKIGKFSFLLLELAILKKGSCQNFA